MTDPKFDMEYFLIVARARLRQLELIEADGRLKRAERFEIDMIRTDIASVEKKLKELK